MKSPIRIVYNKDRYWEVWVGNGHSDFDSVGLGLLIGFAIFGLGIPIIGLLVYFLGGG